MKKIHSLLLGKQWYAKWHTFKHVNAIHYSVLVASLILPSLVFFQNISEVVAANNVATETMAKVAANPVKRTPVPLPTQAIRNSERVIVKFSKGLDKRGRDDAVKSERMTSRGSIAKLDLDVYQVDADDTVEEVVDRLRARGKSQVEFVEIDKLLPPLSVPNDPNFDSEWHVPKIGAQNAWDVATGTNIVVAVLDTGVDCTHPDLVANCLPGWNVVSGTNDSSDVYGHGTWVAGTIAAIANNSVQGAGVAHGVKILPIRITNDPTGWAYFSDIANGLTYAADHGAKIANNSYQGFLSSYYESAAQYMYSKGGLVVNSAGNDNTLTDTGNSPYITVVSATDSNDAKASWSTFGNIVDMSAPGVAIYTTARGGGSDLVSGTSFASPITAAVMALMWSANPLLSNTQIQDMLYQTGKDLGTAGWDNLYGWGRVDAYAAVMKAATTTVATTTVIKSDTTAPSVPANLRATVISSTKVSLAWSASTDTVGVTGYDIYRKGVKIGSSSGASYSDSTVTASTTYEYTVVAYDAAGNRSLASAPVTVTTSVAPLTISSYSVGSKTASSTTVSWATNKVSSGYVKYGTSARSLTKIVPSSTLSGTSHRAQLTGLTGRTTYYYQIVASSTGEQATSRVSSFKTSSR